VDEIPVAQTEEYWADGVSGYGAIEIQLTRMLKTSTKAIGL
jgi:hypothetical protein